MFKLSASQIRSLDAANDERFVRRLSGLLAPILFESSIDKLDATEAAALGQSIRLARERAAEMGLDRAGDVATYLALSAVFKTLPTDTVPVFQEHVGSALRREQSPGEVRLALALRALKTIAVDNPSAAIALRKVDLLRDQFQ